MSYQDQQGGPPHYGSNNPFGGSGQQQPGYGQQQQHGYGQQQPNYGQQQQQCYNASQGPPPDQAPARSNTFKESDFVPDGERGEQREAMEQFEMSKGGHESQQDKDVAQLQQEFPGLDGSLIAALYSDNGSLGATRETLQELAGGSQ